MKVSLILPCYNEMEHIRESLPRIYNFLEFCLNPGEFEIILVDDGSRDGTRDWLKSHVSGRTPYVVLLNERNLGRGGAVKEGMKLARGQMVGFMDIDCEVSEAYLPTFIYFLENGFDFVIGDRIYQVTPLPYIVFRHLLSLGYKGVCRKLLGLRLVDTEVGYKFFSQTAAKEILAKSKYNDWFWDTEASYLMEKNGFKVKEVPVAFRRNKNKTSTVNSFSDSLKYLKALKKFRSAL